MSNKLVQKLANKFIDTHFDSEKLKKQKEVFEKFYYENLSELKSAITEMTGDLLILKEKQLPIDLRQLLGKVFQQILDMYKEIDPKDPYPGTLKLINWANTRNNKTLLENLDFLIQKHLEKKEINFHGKDTLKQPRASSINLFLQIIPKLQQFILNNPSIEEEMLSKLIDEDPAPISGPEDSTKLI